MLCPFRVDAYLGYRSQFWYRLARHPRVTTHEAPAPPYFPMQTPHRPPHLLARPGYQARPANHPAHRADGGDAAGGRGGGRAAGAVAHAAPALARGGAGLHGRAADHSQHCPTWFFDSGAEHWAGAGHLRPVPVLAAAHRAQHLHRRAGRGRGRGGGRPRPGPHRRAGAAPGGAAAGPAGAVRRHPHGHRD